MTSTESRTVTATQHSRQSEPRPARSPQTMKTAVIAAPGRVEWRDAPRPDPGPTQVRIRLEGCGVCASNLPVWEGRPWFEYPLEPGSPGHEGWGIVDAVGANVDGVAVGDRVAALTYHAFAECDLAEAEAVVRLPEAVADIPFPGEPLGCAVNVFQRSDIHPGHSVAVVGVGFLGAVLVRLAKNAGAHVTAVSRRPFALETARRAGADVVLPLEARDSTIDQIRALTGGEGCDRVIEATGRQGPLDLASELVRVRGKLIVAGYHQDGLRQVNMQSWNWRGIDVINAHERDPRIYRSGMQLAMELVRQGEIDPRPWFTHTYPWDDLGDALEATRRRPDGFLKALVLMPSEL